MKPKTVNAELSRIGNIISRLADRDIFTWLNTKKQSSHDELHRAATIVADRLCGAVSDPIIRNAQEKRQLTTLKSWLKQRKYTYLESRQGLTLENFMPGTFAFHFNVQIKQAGRSKHVNIPIDAIVMPRKAKRGHLPLLIEAKSAGDFTNTNKRRKDESTKVAQLRATYGDDVRFVLFLCGYFDSGYLGYEAAEGIDWVWEHRIDDLERLGL